MRDVTASAKNRDRLSQGDVAGKFMAAILVVPKVGPPPWPKRPDVFF